MSEYKKTKLGFLYPGYAAEDDYPKLRDTFEESIDVALVHTDFIEDAHTVDALSEMGSIKNLQEGAQKLKNENVQSVLWTSTSASFVLGKEGIEQQVQVLESFLQVPASTTAIAFARAAQTINAKKVVIAAPYPRDVALLFKQFIESYGIEVIQYESKGIITAAEVGTLRKDDVLAFARNSDVSDADALFIPDTALHTIEWLEELEEMLQKPVLTANQVSFWEALWLADVFYPKSGFGTLFSSRKRIL